jgi:hypothetical protein
MGRGRWSILARRAALNLQGYLVTSYRSVVAQNARFILSFMEIRSWVRAESYFRVLPLLTISLRGRYCYTE